ncbi:hypothetical protein [Rhodopseudomonas pseudopalustris]|uniref:Uncharacterized protein n=1 Tax=Rhodopseudomonas pseudopalustris TaxID=1513892 RepID=A0A1H8U3U2_9BRAD|nr:hypothetical protein [Rhodopseudomonas pseudopalustris]MBB1091180.1 hypothetical protein [Rhodopseudomonas palustris]SEO97513.1 hypothetical protein SAMN05444123_106258 [Rhodopseudomonas pseudopalustris]
MAMLTYDDHPIDALIGPAASAEQRAETAPDDDVEERWLQSLPLPRRLFARFYRALRKLQPMFPPMSCC